MDVFDGAYPYMVTQRDSALVFPLCWMLDQVDCKSVKHPMEINLGDERLVIVMTSLGCLCYARVHEWTGQVFIVIIIFNKLILISSF